MVCKAGTSGSRIEYIEFSNHLSVTNITKIDNSRISDGVIRITSLAAKWRGCKLGAGKLDDSFSPVMGKSLGSDTIIGRYSSRRCVSVYPVTRTTKCT